MSGSEALTRFEVIFDAEGTNAHKFRNDVTVHKHPPHPATVELPTDEAQSTGATGRHPIRLRIS